MTDNLEVAHSGSEGEPSDEQRHEVVAAQLRGEAKAAGRGPDAVVAAVAEEIEGIGLEPNPAELHRRYEEIDPDVPVVLDADDADAADDADGAADAPADADASDAPADVDGPVSAGVDAARDHSPVDEGGGGPAPR
jgi:hypothetical protein